MLTHSQICSTPLTKLKNITYLTNIIKMKPEAQRQGNQNMRKWFISWFLKSLQSLLGLCVYLSRKQKDLSRTTENNKFMVWMENNKFHPEIEDNDNPDCCAKCNFVWNPISFTWEANFEI
ncbi:hypothetical protein YC2023_012508 [Brassica napus]